MSLKIGILTNMPTPYRNGLWKEYSEIENVDIDFFYCTVRENDRYWEVDKKKEFNEVFLPGITFKRINHLNLKILNYFNRYDIWIIGGYSIPTTQILIILCRIFKKTYILMVDGINPQKLDNKGNKLFEKIKKYYITGQTYSFANGTVGKKLMIKYGLKEDLIYNQFLSVDNDWFFSKSKDKDIYRKEVRKKYDIFEDDFTLLYVGRIVESKGIEDLLNAANKLRKQGLQVKVLVVGEGVLRQKLEEEYSSNYNIFCGEIKYSELYKYYFATDIFVLPTYDDVWGLTINEAMACGVPVITTTSAGAYIDLINNKNFTYEAGDIDGLVDSILYMLGLNTLTINSNFSERNNFQLQQIGKKNQEKIKLYSYQNSKNELQKLLQKCIND